MSAGELIEKRIRFYAILAFLIWSFLCGLVLYVNSNTEAAKVVDSARIMARTSTDKDIAYRHWVAERGGVYAQVSDSLPPNPYLNVPERDIVTPSGRQLTLVNPAYMTRQVFEQDFPLDTSLWSHITSLNPLRPANAPDDWETRALESFERGVKEYGENWNYQGKPVYRFMRPLWVEESCLRCHGDQGYKIGDLRGGISVMVPIDRFVQEEKKHNDLEAATVGGIWLAGLFGIGFSWRRIRQGTRDLLLQQENMHQLFETAPNGLLLFNHSCEIVMANRTFRDKYCRTESPCGKRVGDIVHCEHAENDPRGCGFRDACRLCPIHTALLAAFEHNLPTDGHECRVTALGEVETSLVFQFSVTPLTIDNEEGALLTLSDISAQKLAEQEREKMRDQLLQTRKIESVGRLAGGVAHDFNNMLATIMGNVELALLRLGTKNKARDHLLQIKDAADRSAGLTRQLLGFARQQPMEPRVLVLDDAIAAMLKILKRLVGEDMSLVWKPASRKARLLIDPSQLDQIMTNLVVNARDAITAVGTLVLSTDLISFNEDYCQLHPWCKSGDYIQLSVSDDGCGMSRDVLEHIFEPFFTTKDVDKGAGLGLANVYGIVKQNNGFINVYSEPGQGTTFRIYFPQTGEEIGKKGPMKEAASLRGDETVLLVEDEEMLLEIGRRILEEAGYQVIVSLDPLEALQLAAEYGEQIDLLLTDVIMPKLNGKELAERLSAVRPNIKVLYMSGYAADIIVTRGLLEEGVELLQKPFSTEELTTKLRAVLDS